MVQGRWMELYKLHVLNGPFCTVNHRYAVACGYQRIGRCLVNGTYAAGCNQRYLGKEGVDSSVRVHDIGSVAFYIRCLTGDGDTQMVLRQYFDCEMILKYGDVGVLLDGLNQAILYFGTCIVFMVQDAEFGMSPFTVQVEVAFLVLVEVYTPTD